MAKQVTIVAGDVSDKAVQWLKAHGALIEGFDLLTITLPEQAQVQRGSHGWDYTIAFYNDEGNDEASWIEIELYIDAYDTSLSLKFDGDRDCSCKGRGCAECVEELAAITRGENPYAHHTQVPTTPPQSPAFTYVQDGTEHQARSIDWNKIFG